MSAFGRPRNRTKYSYDNAFRITGITDTSPGAANWTYGYDALDRITSGTSTSITRGWTYDANGNRLTETGTSPSTYTISTTSNQIASISGALARTYGYDAAGNTTGYASVTASYNDAGRLKTLTQGGSTEMVVYNALGARIEKTGGTAGTVLFWYDEAGHLLGEYDGSGALIQETVWLGDIPIATLRPNGSSVSIYYVHSDQLNTPRQVTRPSDNAQMWTWFSDPFGTDAANGNPAGLGTFPYNLRFPGQYYDAETGLNYNMARDYDSTTGRYIESDPIGLQGGGNTYTYAQDAPTMTYDPDGQDAIAYMMQHPLGLGDGPSWLSPAVKSLICKTINDCAGNMNCVFNTLNKARRKNWFDPVLRQAENFATAAADDSVTGYPLSWAAHNSLGVWWYQYQTKPAMIRNHAPTTPVSDDAYAAGIAGVYFHGLDPSVAQKWCSKDCKK